MSDSAGGKEVGRISIRVVPNLDKFYRDLQDKLEEVEKTLEGKIHFSADLDHIREQVKAETEGMEAKVKVRADTDLFQKRMLADLAKANKANEIKIPLTPDGERFRRAFDEQIKSVGKEAREKIPIDLELAAGQREKIAAEVAALKKIASIEPIKLKLDPEADYGLHQRVAKAAEVKLQLKDKEAKAQLALTLAEMKARARAANVDVKVGVDQKGIGGLLGSLMGAGDAAGSTGQQFLGLSRMGWIVVAVFAAAAPVIGLVAGLLAGLPSLILAAALPMGAIALGLKGIQEAADASGFLAEGKKGKQGPGAGLKTLQDSVSQVFKTGLTPVFEQLTTTLLPSLQTGFGQVAQGLVNVAQGFTNVVTSAVGLQQIQTIFKNVGGFLTNLSPILGTFTKTFLTLGEQGSKAFGLLIAPFDKFATSFDQMINRVASNGTLNQAFQGLSQVTDSILSLFTRLFDVGLTAMGKLGQPIKNLVDGLGDTLVSLMPALTSVSSFIGNVAGALGKALAPAIDAVTPGFTAFLDTLGAAITDNLPALTPMLIELGNAISGSLLKALEIIKPHIPAFIESFKKLTEVITGKLKDQLPRLIDSFGTLIGLMLDPEFNTKMLDFFTRMIEIIPDLVPKLADLATKFTGLFEKVDLTKVGEIVTDISTLSDKLSTLSSTVAGFPTFGLTGLLSAGSGTGGGPLGGQQQFAPDLKAKWDEVWNGIKDTATQVWGIITTAISTAVDKVNNYISQIPDKVGHIWDGIADSASTAWDDVVQAVSNTFGRIVQTIGTGVSQAVTVVAALPGQIAGVVAGAAGVLISAGVALMDGLLAGIKSALGKVLSFVDGIAGEIAKHKGPLPTDRTTLIPNGQALMDGLQTGLEGGFEGVLGRARQLAGEISDAINSGKPIDLSAIKSQVHDQMANLGKESDLLKVQRDNTTDKGQKKAITAQLQQITAIRDQLKLQEDQLGITNQTGQATKEQKQFTDQLGQSFGKLMSIGTGFATATSQQFQQDLGMSGHGAIQSVAQYGLGYATQALGSLAEGFISGALGGGGTTIHVGSVDEALTAKQTLDNRQAMQFVGR